MTIGLVIVWATVLGISLGLALVVIPLSALALDRYDPELINRLIGHAAE